MIPFPDINPVALSIPLGFTTLAVRWYGLAYISGFFAGFYYLKLYMLRAYPVAYSGRDVRPLPWDDLFFYCILGIILGGRLGYVMFYNPAFYLQNPLAIVQFWHGGMAYHGGMIGVVLAVWYFARKHSINYFDIIDRVAPGVCFGLFFGRMANFINAELWGRVTDVPWAMIFPTDPDQLPRHPSQLYQAALEGIVLFVILHLVARKRLRKFEISGLFLLFYGIFRFLVEYVRQPDNLAHLQQGIFTYITMGQLLSLPMIGLGLYLVYLSRKHDVTAARPA